MMMPSATKYAPTMMMAMTTKGTIDGCVGSGKLLKLSVDEPKVLVETEVLDEVLDVDLEVPALDPVAPVAPGLPVATVATRA
jgi:hypothetical protein